MSFTDILIFMQFGISNLVTVEVTGPCKGLFVVRDTQNPTQVYVPLQEYIEENIILILI